MHTVRILNAAALLIGLYGLTGGCASQDVSSRPDALKQGYETALQQCQGSEESSVAVANALRDMNLPVDTLQTVLAYHYARLSVECPQSASDAYYQALLSLDAEQRSAYENDLQLLIEIRTSDAERLQNMQAVYAVEVPESVRNQIRQQNVFSAPFHPVRVLERLTE